MAGNLSKAAIYLILAEWITILAVKPQASISNKDTGQQDKIIFLIYMVALKRAVFGFGLPGHSLLGAGVLGDGLGALRDGVLGQLSGQQEPDGGLDLPGGDGGPLVVVGELAGLSGDALEQVVDERVHDAHGLGGDTGVGVHLLEDLVDVDGIRLLPLAFAFLLVALGNCLGSLAALDCSFA